MNLRLGCGSWTDDEYKGVLYPSRLPASERLATYATRFNHVEVNATFHAMQRVAVVANWAKQTPPEFTFSVKLLKAFSNDPQAAAADGELARRFLVSVQPLIEAQKLTCLFLLLNPSFSPNRHRLEELDSLIAQFQPHPLAIELRHPGWVDEEHREQTLAFYRERKLIWIAVDMPQIPGAKIMPPVDEVTRPDFAYLRLHGRNPEWPRLKTAGERHTYLYPPAELEEIAARVRHFASRASCVHVIANNHAQDFAPKTALALQRLLGVASNDEAGTQGELF